MVNTPKILECTIEVGKYNIVICENNDIEITDYTRLPIETLEKILQLSKTFIEFKEAQNDTS